MKREARHRMHQHRLAQGRAEPAQAAQMSGASMCTKGSGTNSVKPPVSRLQLAQAQQMPRPMQRTLDMAEHDRRGGRSPTRCAASHHVEPCAVVELVGADDGAHLVVENFGGGAGQRAETRRRLSSAEEIGHAAGRASPRRAQTSSGEKA